ncbi:hypothetical protein DAEQUDRAFT_741910 [Daedalea quercina L-15889]|uniref:C2H2-type domain-containing protein n=1 Tax=Daedalea quercina L-15889 TaxID=1314783 RepID=A0A165KQU7_9APHY|nr:hypothetical protein DAEQUDRAFT_741910 [Daedalea quercina L-15889]
MSIYPSLAGEVFPDVPCHYPGHPTEEKIECFWINDDGFKCGTSIKVDASKPFYDIAQHVGKVHFRAFECTCSECHKSFASADSLKRHCSNVHHCFASRFFSSFVCLICSAMRPSPALGSVKPLLMVIRASGSVHAAVWNPYQQLSLSRIAYAVLVAPSLVHVTASVTRLEARMSRRRFQIQGASSKTHHGGAVVSSVTPISISIDHQRESPSGPRPPNSCLCSGTPWPLAHVHVHPFCYVESHPDGGSCQLEQVYIIDFPLNAARLNHAGRGAMEAIAPGATTWTNASSDMGEDINLPLSMDVSSVDNDSPITVMVDDDVVILVAEPQGRLYRICELAVQHWSDSSPTRAVEQCGTVIRGDNPNELTRAFENHLRSRHPPTFYLEGSIVVSNCEWLYGNGELCRESLKQYSASRPCYAIAQHVAKKISHFGLYQCYCERVDCGCEGRFASRDARNRHYDQLEHTHTFASNISAYEGSW